MSSLARTTCVLALFCLGPLTLLQGGLFDWLFPKRQVEVITVTEMTPEGRKVPGPTQENPVYYVAVSLGFQDLGGVMGGERIPPKEMVLQTITATLAKQGYLQATTTSPPPTLILAFAWGTLNADFDYGFNPDDPPQQRNRQQILKFIGGYKMGFSDNDFDPLIANIAGLTFMNFDSRKFYDAAEDDFYIAVVSAYDLEALQQRQKKLLWMTRISCPSLGFWLDDVLPTMMAIAGPNIGRETNKPIWVQASDKYRTEVKMGELEILENLGPGPLPVIEAPSAKNGQENKGRKTLPGQDATSAKDGKAAPVAAEK